MKNTIHTKTLQHDTFEESISHVHKIVSEHGFGILYTIDFAEMSIKKRGIDMGKYLQIGICHPDIGFAALNEDKSFGALLPCPLCVYEDDNKITVSIVDSHAQLSIHPLYTDGIVPPETLHFVSDLFGDL